MEKIILYGAGETFNCYRKLFLELQGEKKFKIIGISDRKLQGSLFCGFPVISLNEIKSLDFDYVVITAEDSAANSISNDLFKANIPKSKIVSLYSYAPIEEKLNEIDRKQLSVQLNIISKLLTASDDEVGNFEWMRNIVGQYGIYPWRSEDMDGTGNVVGTRAGMIQRPNEFAKYCVYLSKWKVNNAIEIGVYRGKSSYFMCALLARKNPNLIYELVDIVDGLSNYEDFHKLLPQMKKKIPSTSDDYVGKVYDFVFIDADHSYDGSFRDYMNLGRYAQKLTVFHDIYAHEYDHQNGGCVRTWKEVVNNTPEYEHHIFSEYPGQWMGIGVIEYNKCK